MRDSEFNRGHPRFFDQSEADSLTKNFDFVVFKANQIQSKISNLAVGTDATDPKYLDRNQTSRFTDQLKFMLFISNLKSRNGLYSNQQTS